MSTVSNATSEIQIWAYNKAGDEVFPTPAGSGAFILSPRFGPADRHRDVNDVVADFADAVAKLNGGCWYIFMYSNGRDNRFEPQSLYPQYLFRPEGAPVVSIDQGEAHAAATPCDEDGPQGRSYVNRISGKVITVWETREEAENATTPSVAAINENMKATIAVVPAL